MKTTTYILSTVIIVSINSFHLFSQNGDLSYPTPSSMYVGSPVESEKALMDAATTAYENNKKYRDDLINWVFDLKKKSDDKQFLAALDSYYKQLKAFDNEGRFEYYKSPLDRIKLSINEEISKYDDRKRTTKRDWDEAVANYKGKNYQEAILGFNKVADADPSYAYTYLYRGNCSMKLGWIPQAFKEYNKFIELQPNEASGYIARGNAYMESKNYQDALTDFNRVIEMTPDSAGGYLSRGLAKSNLNDEDGAILDYSKAIQLRPNYSMAYNNRGWSKFKSKKYSEALTELNKAIELDNFNWVAYDSRQEIKFALNDFKGCVADCNLAISLNPKCANSYLLRGRANYKQGDKTKACEDWNKASELGKAEASDFITKYCNNGGR